MYSKYYDRFSLLFAAYCFCAVTAWGPPRATADEPTLGDDSTGDVNSAAEATSAAEAPNAEVAALWNEKAIPLLGAYCVDCHNADFQEAELDLESAVNLDAVLDSREHWEKILQRIRFDSMPPEDASQPTDEERSELILAIESVLYGTACDLTTKPGRVTVRRLNRSEYNNTIRDIFGQDLRPADNFPADEVGAGFDNNGDVLSLSPMLFEKYLAAAEEVAKQVIFDPEDVERIKVERSGETLHALGTRFIGSFYKFYMLEDGVVWAQFDAPYDGNYELRVAGSAGQPEQEVKLAIYNTAGTLLDTVELKYADGGGSHSRSFRLELTAGTHRFFVVRVGSGEEPAAQLEASNQLDEQALAAALASESESLPVDRGFDRDGIAFAVKSLTLSGPRGIPDALLPSGHRRLISDMPRQKKQFAKAARPGLTWLLRRAFRGPVDEETLNSYVALVQMAAEREDNFARGMQIGVAAILVSPRFLYRVELPPAEVAKGNAAPLSDHQLATRLAYFLWSSTPDERLLDLADEGKLIEPTVLVGEVERLLADPRSEALADNFAAQWLGLRNLDTAQPDASRFTEFNDALRGAMLQETRLLFLDVVREDRSVLDLLDADFTFLNQQLAEHYGIAGVEGAEFRRVALGDTPRRGILTHASVLTLTSNPTRTSPVKRGKWILENILGTPPPEPPVGVPELEAAAESNPDASFREQLEIHRADPNCASCHRTMDALGFGFETFNVIGSYREQDGKYPIDASGELPGGLTFDGPLELIKILRQRNGEQFARTTVERLLTFALGRELRFEDRCLVDDIVRQARSDDFRFSSLVRETVLSSAFRLQQAEGT